MPKDVAIGRQLAAVLTEAYLGNIKNVSFTYDGYVELDALGPDPYVFITVETAPFVREGRSPIRRTCGLRLTSISAQGPTDNSQWVDDQLNSIDSLLELVFQTTVGERQTTPLAIEYDDRFDLEKFQTHKRLVASALINYGNL